MQKTAGSFSSGQVLIKVIMFLCVASIGVLGVIYFQYALRPDPQFFFVTTDRKLIAKQPLDKPNVSTKALLRWAASAATAANTLDFVHYEANLEAVREYFTADGYKSFMASLESAQVLDEIRDKKLVVSAVVSGSPVILIEGETKGQYSWGIQIPMLVSYQGASEQSVKRNKVVTLLVTRVPTTEAPKGIGIAQMVSVDIS